MSPWVKFILPKIGQSIAGAHWETIVRQVKSLAADSNLTGAEKRERVRDFVLECGAELAGFVLNLAIEVAVAWLAGQGKIDAGQPK